MRCVKRRECVDEIIYNIGTKIDDPRAIEINLSTRTRSGELAYKTTLRYIQYYDIIIIYYYVCASTVLRGVFYG